MPYSAYSVTGVSPYEDIRGFIVLGDVTQLRDILPGGNYIFRSEDAELEFNIVRPALRGVRSVRVLSPSGEELTRLWGDIILKAGENIRLDVDEANNTIIINAIPGEGMVKKMTCETTSGIKTINGIDVRELEIVGDGECVQVQTSGNKIIISDTCSKPCCGCEELKKIQDVINRITRTNSTITQSIGDLKREIGEFWVKYISTISGPS